MYKFNTFQLALWFRVSETFKAVQAWRAWLGNFPVVWFTLLAFGSSGSGPRLLPQEAAPIVVDLVPLATKTCCWL